MIAVGVDACKAGWVGVRLDAGGTPEAVFAPTLERLAAQVPDADGFGVDIPIGLPARGGRAADVEAREAVGARRNSVFLAPPREVLEAATHAEAVRVARRLTGQGVSQQAYALRRKIFEAEAWRRTAPAPVWEVHPEVSFSLLLGQPPRWPKKTWAGLWERLEGLRAAGIALGDVGGAGGSAAPDDVLDAAVAAWSARRLLDGRGVSLPEQPEADPVTGAPMAIWA